MAQITDLMAGIMALMVIRTETMDGFLEMMVHGIIRENNKDEKTNC
jgi:hypothetical protein